MSDTRTRAEREAELARQLAEFKAKGGQVTVAPPAEAYGRKSLNFRGTPAWNRVPAKARMES